MKPMQFASLSLGFTIFFAASLAAQVDAGDRHYASRSSGHQGARAKAGAIDDAIAAYRQAVAASSGDLEARWKLLRAYRFKAAYAAANQEEKKKIYSEAKNFGEESIHRLEKLLAPKGIASLGKAPEKKVAEALRSIPHAAELVYWDSAIWGEWALVYGKMAAVKQGAADRLKRESTIVRLTDPSLEGGGGARILGRLHNQTPRVPFLTGWASDSLAVKYLRESLSHDPTNKLTKVFLAEAMVAADKGTKAEAVRMLNEVLSAPNDDAYIVEQIAAQEDARKLLRDWGTRQ